MIPLQNWIIILNFNLTEYCLARLTDLNKIEGVGLVFVDNQSRDDEYNRLKSACILANASIVEAATVREVIDDAMKAALSGSKLILCRSPENLGYSGGNNIALKALYKAIGKKARLLILNPDVVIDKMAGIRLLNHASEICGPAIYEDYLNGVRPVEQEFDFSTGFGWDRLRHKKHQATGLLLTGCCLKLTGEALERYGLLPEENFLYDEEIFYFERVNRFNGTPIYLDDVVVRHIGSASIGKRSFTYFYYIFRNRLVYFLEVARPQHGRVLRFSYLYARMLWSIFYTNLKRRNWAGLKGIALGVRDGLLRKKGPYSPSIKA